MLKVTWKAANVGAPYTNPGVKNDTYFAQVDSLNFDGQQDGQPMERAVAAFTPIAAPNDAALATWLGDKRRVVVMVHGFLYDPTGTSDVMDNDPTETVYGVPATVKLGNSWLPLVGEYDADGTQQIADLAIGFAWCSDASLVTYGDAGWSNFYQMAVWDQAGLAAKGLASLLEYLGRKGIAVDILAHSLGTRVTAQAIGMLSRAGGDKAIGKVILLDGAEFCVDAFSACSGRNFQVFNIVNRDDHVLTLGAAQMCHPVRWNGSDAARVIGRDGLIPTHRWLDIQLDREAAQDWLIKNDFPVTPDPDQDDVHPQAWLRHWVCYTNAKNRKLVGALIQDPSRTIDWFLQNGFPAGTDAIYYGHFNSFIPKTPPDCATRVACTNWAYSDYESYNQL